MTIELWWIGKTNDKHLQPGIMDYQKRIKRFNPFEIREFSPAKGKRPEDQILSDEQQILRNLDDRDYLIILDEKGTLMDSIDFSSYLDRLLVQPVRRLIFLIGGAYGFGEVIRTRANAMLALSPLTFTHDMVRLIFLEQLYRSFTIKNNLPYHH